MSFVATGEYRVMWECGVYPGPCGELGCGPAFVDETKGTTKTAIGGVATPDGTLVADLEIAAQPAKPCPDGSSPWCSSFAEWGNLTIAELVHGLVLTPEPIAWGWIR